jgi:2'-5' RNA ligase
MWPWNSIRAVRLFLAIDPGDDCRHRLASVVALMRATSNGVRWVRDGNLHVTLSFLGEVADARVEEITGAMQQLSLRHRPFAAAVAGSGVFPDWRRPRIVWLGLRDTGGLTELGTDVGRMCTTLGFPPDHAFRAHVTIGRITRPLSVTQRDELKRALNTLSEVYPFDVTRVALMRSTVGPGGSEYSEVASFPLGGA